jgi:hypothetical protein
MYSRPRQTEYTSAAERGKYLNHSWPIKTENLEFFIVSVPLSRFLTVLKML